MKTYVDIKGQKIDAKINGNFHDADWNDRESKTITANMTYDQAKNLFTDDTPWSIVQEFDPVLREDGSYAAPTQETYDNSDYCISGPITDNRDGTVSIKMGKLLPGETLVLVMGRAVGSVTQARAMRRQVEQTYRAAAMTTDQRIAARFMAAAWKKGRHAVGELYCTDPDRIWQCRQAYDNQTYPDIVPGNDAWYTFNVPLHGTTPETALPFVLPKEAESRYKAGEYMIWTDGKCYKCMRDSSYGPDQDAQAWTAL